MKKIVYIHRGHRWGYEQAVTLPEKNIKDQEWTEILTNIIRIKMYKK